MKQHKVLFIIFWTLSTICYGQQDSTENKTAKFGISLGSNVTPTTNGLNFFVYLTLEKGKSFYALGPVIGPKLKIRTDNYYGTPTVTTGKYAINGFHALYQINPNPIAKVFNLFFQYEFDFLYYQDEGQDFYDPQINGAYKAYELWLENYVGYGFKLNFSRILSLTQSVGIGYIYHKSEINGIGISGYDGIGLNAKLALNFLIKK